VIKLERDEPQDGCLVDIRFCMAVVVVISSETLSNKLVSGC
jgi:hypothetical protein